MGENYFYASPGHIEHSGYQLSFRNIYAHVPKDLDIDLYQVLR